MSGETKIYLAKKYFRIDLAGPDSVILSVYRFDLCNIISRSINKYPSYVFQRGEEMQVRLDIDRQLQYVAPILNIEDLAKKLLTQMNNGSMAKDWKKCLEARV